MRDVVFVSLFLVNRFSLSKSAIFFIIIIIIIIIIICSVYQKDAYLIFFALSKVDLCFSFTFLLPQQPKYLFHQQIK